jgi:hypothetical protein
MTASTGRRRYIISCKGEKNRLRERGFLFMITPGCEPSRPHPAIRQIMQKGVTRNKSVKPQQEGVEKHPDGTGCSKRLRCKARKN